LHFLWQPLTSGVTRVWRYGRDVWDRVPQWGHFRGRVPVGVWGKVSKRQIYIVFRKQIETFSTVSVCLFF